MQINSIGLANYYGKNSLKTQKKNPKSNNNISEPTYNNIPSLSFYGTRAKIRKPELQKEISKKIVDKFQKFPNERRIPEGVCTFFELNGKKYAVRIDKVDKDRTSFIIKSNVDNASSFDTPEIGKESIQCIFNKDGYMVFGELLKKINKNYTRKFVYTAERDVVRRIKTDGALYRPADGTDRDLWHLVKDRSTNTSIEEINFKKEFKDLDFAELFFELTKHKTTIL